jgi:uncharacterized membrane protein (GlpM family)
MIGKETDSLSVALKFVFGGGIIAGVTWLTRYADPKYGGILAAAPITTTIAFVFTNYESGQTITRQLVHIAFYFAIPSLIFLACLFFLMSRVSLLQGLAGAYAVWLVGVLIKHMVLVGL